MRKQADPRFFERLFRTSEAKLRITKPNEILEEAFTRQMKANVLADNMGDGQLLIYLHGFNTTFKEAAQTVASIGYQLKMTTTAFFSWPSKGGMKNYAGDKEAADFSQDSIGDFIIKAYSESGGKKVHLIAHSMGNYALLNALCRPNMQAAIENGLKFGQIILAAPDVESIKFKKDAGILAGISDRVSLYVSDGDLALKTSRSIASKNSRAGLRPPVTTLKKIDTVDVSSTNMTLLDHAFVSAEVAVLNDMHKLIFHNELPERRISIAKKENYWTLK